MKIPLEELAALCNGYTAVTLTDGDLQDIAYSLQFIEPKAGKIAQCEHWTFYKSDNCDVEKVDDREFILIGTHNCDREQVPVRLNFLGAGLSEKQRKVIIAAAQLLVDVCHDPGMEEETSDACEAAVKELSSEFAFVEEAYYDPTMTLLAMMTTEEHAAERAKYRRFTVPAGKYWLGDLCYIVSSCLDATEHLDDWVEFLDLCDTTDESVLGVERSAWCALNGHYEKLTNGTMLLAFGTYSGDGTYTDQFGFEYSVDSGLLGLVPIEYCKDMVFPHSDLCQQVEFTEETLCFTHNGIITFGKYVIDTMPAPVEL